jgi:HK97 family phage prohead protease
MNKQLELRFVDAELSSTDEGLRVAGYVNKTNQWSQTLGTRKKFVERILPGAFSNALSRENEVHFLAEHDSAKILASTRNNSLQLREDEHGLYMEATISETSWGKDYHTLIKDGIIQNMSFGMQVLRDSWNKLTDGTYERSISDIYLAEVSAVRSPAYVQSTIAARSIDIIEDVEVPDEIENENREESNQMELNIETRDKLVEVLDQILATLKDNAGAQKVAEQAQEVVEKVAESVEEVAEEVVEAVEEVVEKTAEVVENVVEKVKEEAKEVVEEAKDVVEAAKETVTEAVEEVTEVVTEAVKETVDEAKAPDLSEFYKKLLDLA